jgi:hypothetical protein
MFGSIRLLHCTALALQHAREPRARQTIGQLFLKHRSHRQVQVQVQGPWPRPGHHHLRGALPQRAADAADDAGLGDAGKVGALRRGCHATDAGPPTHHQGLCERAFTAHQLQNTVMPFDVSTTSPSEACASEISHQLSSSHKCSSELSCSSHDSPSHQSPVNSQHHSSVSAPVRPGPDKARAPHTSFPCSWVPLRLSPTIWVLFPFVRSHSESVLMALDLRVPMSQVPQCWGKASEATDKPPFLHYSHDCWSTTSSALCFADCFLMLPFSPAASLPRTFLS